MLFVRLWNLRSSCGPGSAGRRMALVHGYLFLQDGTRGKLQGSGWSFGTPFILQTTYRPPSLPPPTHLSLVSLVYDSWTTRPSFPLPATASLLSQTTKLGDSSHLSDPFDSFCFHITPRVQEPLLAQINPLHARDILRRGPRHAGRDDDRVCLEDYTFVDYLIDGEREEIVVFNESAFVGGISVGGCILAFNLDLMEWKRLRD